VIMKNSERFGPEPPIQTQLNLRYLVSWIEMLTTIDTSALYLFPKLRRRPLPTSTLGNKEVAKVLCLTAGTIGRPPVTTVCPKAID
jgi:hypothetical protein